MSDHPTLLRRPTESEVPSRTEEVLPGLPTDYLVEHAGEVWKVTAVGTGKLVTRVGSHSPPQPGRLCVIIVADMVAAFPLSNGGARPFMRSRVARVVHVGRGGAGGGAEL